MKKHLALTLVLTALVLPSAFAEDPAPTAAALETSREPASVAAPYTEEELRSVENETEAKVRELRQQEMNELRITLGRRQPKNRMADLYFRLAETQMEAYHATFLLEGRVHDKRQEKGIPDKIIDQSHSRGFLRAGIKACQDLLAIGIPYEKMDQVYYFLGFGYGELADQANPTNRNKTSERKKSLEYFTELTKKYPSSAFVGEAYREMGDAAAGEDNWPKAQAFYELASKKSPEDALPRVYHKLAWSFFRQRQFDKAVDAMKIAIAKASSAGGEKFLSLKEEALRDMAIFMTESGKVDEAIAYFQGTAGDKNYYARALEKLGKQYERNLEPAKATHVYESLLKTHPETEAAFRVMVKLVELDIKREHYKEALARIKDAQIPKGDEADTRASIQNLRAMIRRTATEHHEEYRKRGMRASLETAEDYYTLYLSKFLATEDPRGETPEIQMYLAEVKRDLGKSKEASELYRRVIESKDKRYAKEAGALWTASLAEAIKRSGALTRKENANEPSDLENEFVEAADQLSKSLGETSEAREASLKSAQVLAGYKNTRKDSLKRIKRIIERWPRTQQAVIAARLWLQILSDPANKEDYNEDDLHKAMAEVRSNAQLMAADKEFGGGKLKASINDEETRFKVTMIARNEKEKDYLAAAKGYESFAKDAQARELAEKAYVNSVTNYAKAGDSESVERVANAWFKRFPKSQKAAESTRFAATRFLIDGSFAFSSKLFEKLSREDGDADALETAAKIAEGDADALRAQQLWVSYLDRFKSSPTRFAVALTLGKSQAASRQESAAEKAFKYCLRGPADIAAECGARLGDLYLRNQDFENAKAMYRKVAGDMPVIKIPKHRKKKHAAFDSGAAGAKQAGQAVPEETTRGIASVKQAEPVAGSSPYVGYARFRLADMLEREADFEPLKDLAEAKLKRALSERLEFLEPLSKAYNSAAQAGGPWGVAALDRVAAWALSFADEIMQIPPPKGMDPKLMGQFRAQLESVSAPLRAKALATSAEAYQKALSGEVLCPNISDIADRLADGHTGSPPNRAQGARLGFRLAGLPADGGNDGRETAMKKTRDRLVKDAADASAWLDYGNLLWGQGKPLLARIAYDRALSLNRKNASALNNRAVVLILTEGEEDWAAAAEGAELLKHALREDSFLVPAKINLGSLYTYYRLFAKAKPYWEQASIKSTSPEVDDGLGVVTQGLGNAGQAKTHFDKAQGVSDSRFVVVYHAAAKEAERGPDGASRCLKALGDLENRDLAGFEKTSFEHLKRTCTQWSQAGKK